jgi:hypothetical protein
MTAAPPGYAKKPTAAPPPPPGYSKVPASTAAPVGDEPGLLQRAFDVKNATSGESLLYGNTPAPQPVDDLLRTGIDTGSRGYYDKFALSGVVPRMFGYQDSSGPQEQAETAAARERMPDWVEIPSDIAVSIGTSPYRVAGAAWGGLAGGLEGAASAYGHQEGWVPGGDVLKGTGTGALFGAGGAKLGEKIGDWWSTRQSAKAQPYKTDADLNTAAAADPTGDLAARAARVAKVRGAQG